jgi:hypothetical protein
MGKRGEESKVSIYLPPSVKKRLHKEAIDKGITLGTMVSVACLSWVRGGKKAEMEDRKIRNEFADIDRLMKETEELEAQLEMLLKKKQPKQEEGTLL